MAYGDFKDLTTRKGSNKILHDQAFDIAKNPKYHEYQRGLDSMVKIDEILMSSPRGFPYVASTSNRPKFCTQCFHSIIS